MLVRHKTHLLKLRKSTANLYEGVPLDIFVYELEAPEDDKLAKRLRCRVIIAGLLAAIRTPLSKYDRPFEPDVSMDIYQRTLFSLERTGEMRKRAASKASSPLTMIFFRQGS